MSTEYAPLFFDEPGDSEKPRNESQPNIVTHNGQYRNDKNVTVLPNNRYDIKGRGQPRKYPTNAARQKAYRERQKISRPNRTQFTGEQEWFTPALYLDAVREVLGTIDLDPASNPQAQQTVQAARYFTAQDNALLQTWGGKVFLNPPYNQPLIEHFVVRLVNEFKAAHVVEAILLTHNYTDTKWFHVAESSATSICFTRGRIKFVDAHGKVAAPTQGQAFFYFGLNVAAFTQVFSRFGMVR